MDDLDSRLDDFAYGLLKQQERDTLASREVRFITQELRLGYFAFRRSLDRPNRDMRYEQVVYLRLISEVALRLSWINSEIEQDPASIFSRAIAMEKADLIQLRASSNAIHQRTDGANELDGGMAELIESLPGDPAPRRLDQLAVDALGERLYATHRMCSSIVHAGAALPRADLMPEERARDMTTGTMATVAGLAVMSLAALDGRWPEDWHASGARQLLEEYTHRARGE